MKAITIEAAYSLRLENEVGSIEPGKLANFTVLEDNPLTVAPDTIKDITVWGTVHEGRVLPVDKKEEAKQVSQVVSMKQPFQDDTIIVGKANHEHDYHMRSACTVNRMLASALLKANSQ